MSGQTQSTLTKKKFKFTTYKFFDTIHLVLINAYHANRYSSEDISLIENYHQAIADEEKMWDIHHRRECDENGRTLFTKKQLIEMNLYYNRPAAELIFVTKSMHWKLHRELREKCGKIGGKIAGKIVGKKTGAINGKKRSIPILQFAKDGTFMKEWPSVNEAGRQLGIHNIWACLKGRRKSSGGFVWRYK